MSLQRGMQRFGFSAVHVFIENFQWEPRQRFDAQVYKFFPSISTHYFLPRPRLRTNKHTQRATIGDLKILSPVLRAAGRQSPGEMQPSQREQQRGT